MLLSFEKRQPGGSRHIHSYLIDSGNGVFLKLTIRKHENSDLGDDGNDENDE